MKKHRSVLSLILRSSLVPVLLVLALMALAESGLFYLVLQGNPLSLEYAVQRSRISWVFGAALVLCTLQLCRVGCDGSSKPGYTLNRLSVSGPVVFVWQALGNLLFLLLLWAVQLLLAFGLGRLYAAVADPAFVTDQSLFLAFYRSPFFHTLLPWNDLLLWAADLFLLLALAITAARYPIGQRRGVKLPEVYVVLLCGLLTLHHGLQDYYKCSIAMGVYVAAACYAIYHVTEGGEIDEAEL